VCLKIAPNISNNDDELVAFQWLGEVLCIGCECTSILKEITIVTGAQNTKSWLGDVFSSTFEKISTLFEQTQNKYGVDEKLLERFQNAKTIKINGGIHVLIPMKTTEVQPQTSKKWTVISSVITGVISIGATIGFQFLAEYINL